jgi:hypothetical protein
MSLPLLTGSRDNALQFRTLASSLAMAFAVGMCLELLPYTTNILYGVFSDSIPGVGIKLTSQVPASSQPV